MRPIIEHRPTAALVVATVALFVALGGTGYAVTALPRNSVGADQLQKNAVTAPKIKNGAVTAAKINTTGLTVPSALHATIADSATKANSATSADNATNAANASAVGGLTASQLQGRVNGTCAADSAMRVVNSDGSVTCQTVGSTVLWASVNSGGSIARSSGVIGLQHPTQLNNYMVTFNRDVSGCAYTATIGLPAPNPEGFHVQGQIDVEPSRLDPRAVYIETWNNTGGAALEPFYLIVAC